MAKFKIENLIISNSIISEVSKCGYQIDGKEVYQKIIRFTDNFYNTTISKAHGITDYTRIWIDNSQSYFYHSASKLSYSLNMVGYAGNITSKIYAWIEGDEIKIYSNGGWGPGWEKNIVIKYY